MITQKQIDYQEGRRGDYWSTSLKNVVKGKEVKRSPGFLRDGLGLILGVSAIVGLFLLAVAFGL